jgi:hypothetical protein
VISSAHPNSSPAFESVIFGVGHLSVAAPVQVGPQSIVKLGGAAMLKFPSKSAKSLAMVGLPNASTMTIVEPVPVSVDGKS